MIHLILSLDYEVFGNGAGDVLRDVVDPTRRLLGICDRHGARMTIMFEVGEYWAFERYDRELRNDLGYSPAERMRTQAQDAVQRGHDVQLHLHPQWIGAVYDGGRWRLDNRYWRLADLPDGLGGTDQITSITGALYTGRQPPKEMIGPVKADYECLCFRAGGFYAQPSDEIIPALKRAGLKADTSVVPGYRTDTPFEVDYSAVRTDKSFWWTTDAELVAEGKPGEHVLELPVASRMEPYWNSFKPAKLRAAVQRRRVERASRNGQADDGGERISSVPSWQTVLRKMRTRHASTFDFCKLSCRDMLGRLRELDGPGERPVIMIGHSKDFVNDRHFERFLDAASRRGSMRFVTMAEAVNAALDASGSPSPAGVTDADR